MVMVLAYSNIRDDFLAMYLTLDPPYSLHASNFFLMMDFLLPVVNFCFPTLFISWQILDYGLALRHGTFDEALPLLHLVYIVLCILQSKYYVDWVGMQLLMYEYHLKTKHPAIALQRINWRNMNGEDIELGNRALSHCSKSIRGQADVKILHRSYRLLGCMFETKTDFRKEISKYKSMATWKSNKKVKYKQGEPTSNMGLHGCRR